MLSKINNVLFDLDGTLVDTAPDLANALNRLRQIHNMPKLSFSRIRSVVSLGGEAMIKLAFDLSKNDPEYPIVRKSFLELYANKIYCDTKLFNGMDCVLSTLDKNNIQWGIVTNKPEYLTKLLLEAMSLDMRPTCIVSGDTLPFAKPRPEPLLHACKLMNCTPLETVFIGDAERDIEAGKSAGMSTITARYGYIEENAIPENWGATTTIDAPIELLSLLNIN